MTLGMFSVTGGIISFITGYSHETKKHQANPETQISHTAAIAPRINNVNRAVLWIIGVGRIVLAFGYFSFIRVLFNGTDPRYAFHMFAYLVFLIAVQNIITSFVGICIRLHGKYISCGCCVSSFPYLILRYYIFGSVLFAVETAIKQLNVLAGLIFLPIAAIPIAFYWFCSVKPYRHQEIITKDPPHTKMMNVESNIPRSGDDIRLEELETELRKIPVRKVKQWHSDGKITDEQYKAVARKYNAIRKEIADIKERMELLNTIDKN